MNRRQFVQTASVAALSFVWPVIRPIKSSPSTDQPNVVILVLDSFAARHASFLDYPRSTTPNLHTLAAQSTVYHNHYAGGNFTIPATASLLTGTHPWTHRSLHPYGTLTDKFVERNMFTTFGNAGYQRVALAQTPFAAMLLSQCASHIDYHERLEKLALFSGELLTEVVPIDEYYLAFPTELQQWVGAFNEGSELFQPSSLLLSTLHRVWRGSRRRQLALDYASLFPKGLPQASNAILFRLEETIDWMTQTVVSQQTPFLGYFHLYPPHIPYTPRHDFAELFDDELWMPGKPESEFSEGYSDAILQKNMRDYDQYLAYADAEIGRFLDSLRLANMLDNTIIVVTSDHGEMFERGILGHITPTLYEPIIHIPLIISYPNQTEQVDIQAMTHAVDLLPTLLQACQIEIPSWIEGQFLPQSSLDSSSDGRELLIVDAKRSHRNSRLPIRTAALRHGDYKLIHYFGYEEAPSSFELYDLSVDPHELNDIYDIDISATHQLKSLYNAQLHQHEFAQ